MGKTADRIIADALALSPQVRAFVAERLIESLDANASELSPAWREEVQKRCREIDEETVELHEASEVFANAQASLS